MKRTARDHFEILKQKDLLIYGKEIEGETLSDIFGVQDKEDWEYKRQRLNLMKFMSGQGYFTTTTRTFTKGLRIYHPDEIAYRAAKRLKKAKEIVSTTTDGLHNLDFGMLSPREIERCIQVNNRSMLMYQTMTSSLFRV